MVVDMKREEKAEKYYVRCSSNTWLHIEFGWCASERDLRFWLKWLVDGSVKCFVDWAPVCPIKLLSLACYVSYLFTFVSVFHKFDIPTNQQRGTAKADSLGEEEPYILFVVTITWSKRKRTVALLREPREAGNSRLKRKKT